MKQRIITGILMAIILVPLVLVPSEAMERVFEFVVMLFAVIAMLELLAMYSKEKRIGIPMRIISIILMLFLYLSVTYMASKNLGISSIVTKGIDHINLSTAFQPVTVLLFMLIVLMSGLVFVHDYNVSDLGKLYIAILYVSLCAGALSVLRLLGIRFIVYLFVITISTDIFALVFGMLLGKHKMAPNISPKKTWEGAFGGTIVASILGSLLIIFYPYVSKLFGFGDVDFFKNVFDYQKLGMFGLVLFAILLSISLSVSSQIGDLIASKLKRNFGIKDYSNIFPGHGGVLDRFDSAFFASAIFLLFIFVISHLLPIA
jgi:phosphatidate cytidylyltransferase